MNVVFYILRSSGLCDYIYIFVDYIYNLKPSSATNKQINKICTHIKNQHLHDSVIT